ncbi:MAG: MFS transporter [Chitinophagaceae bacterium]|nr:MFS transporter [Chitinophagaceae bacterium]
MKIITRSIWILSMVSLLADVASELLYPVIPVYLKSIGFTVAGIGLLEGIAELTVGLSKGYFGKQSDERGVRLPFVKLGYLLSALSKPMMALFTYPAWIFLSRTTDRLGKGVRTAARDALLSQQSTPATKARVFAFHRGWDTVGAVTGPILALVYLHYNPEAYKLLFFLAFIPGVLSVALIFLLKEEKKPVSTLGKGNFFSFLSYFKIAGAEYKQLLIGLLIFALGNSSDLFLILRAREITGSDSITISAYIGYNIVYALSSYPMGILADKWGSKRIFLAGLVLFIIVYAGFALTSTAWIIYILFGLYGIYAAATEGIAKAWISNLAHDKNTGTALGCFNSLQSLAAFSASVLAGIVWQWQGSEAVFLMAAFLALVSFVFLFVKAGKGQYR